MQFKEITGDLFKCDSSYSLCHCISEDCRMGKGIAVAFKNNFDGIEELKRQVAQGKIAIIRL